MLFKKLFCKHNYKLISSELTEFGMQKNYYYECRKCGKTKLTHIPLYEPFFGISFDEMDKLDDVTVQNLNN